MGFYQDHCVYLPPMAGWFFFSALLSSYNKLMFETLCAIWPVFFGSDRIDNMSWSTWFSTGTPCGLVTAFDVGLSNLSLVYITITFYTMVKSTTPIFVVAWAYIFGIQKITTNLLLVVFIIVIGEALTVSGELDFKLGGFLLCMSASVLSGARWTLVQLKLQKLDPPLKTTITTMRLLAPSMFFGLIIFSLAYERPWVALADYNFEQLLDVFGLGLLGACLAICMVLCEFYLIMHSNAMVLMIGGVVKELVTIFVGVSFFHDTLHALNATGCFIVFLGVLLYKVNMHWEKQEKLQEMAALEAFSQPLSGGGEGRDTPTTSLNGIELQHQLSNDERESILPQAQVIGFKDNDDAVDETDYVMAKAQMV